MNIWKISKTILFSILFCNYSYAQNKAVDDIPIYNGNRNLPIYEYADQQGAFTNLNKEIKEIVKSLESMNRKIVEIDNKLKNVMRQNEEEFDVIISAEEIISDNNIKINEQLERLNSIESVIYNYKHGQCFAPINNALKAND